VRRSLSGPDLSVLARRPGSGRTQVSGSEDRHPAVTLRAEMKMMHRRASDGRLFAGALGSGVPGMPQPPTPDRNAFDPMPARSTTVHSYRPSGAWSESRVPASRVGCVCRFPAARPTGCDSPESPGKRRDPIDEQICHDDPPGAIHHAEFVSTVRQSQPADPVRQLAGGWHSSCTDFEIVRGRSGPPGASRLAVDRGP
jgi:hypothetical protein